MAEEASARNACGCVRSTSACARLRVTPHGEAGSAAVGSALVLDREGASTYAESQHSQEVGNMDDSE